MVQWLRFAINGLYTQSRNVIGIGEWDRKRSRSHVYQGRNASKDLLWAGHPTPSALVLISDTLGIWTSMIGLDNTHWRYVCFKSKASWSHQLSYVVVCCNDMHNMSNLCVIRSHVILYLLYLNSVAFYRFDIHIMWFTSYTHRPVFPASTLQATRQKTRAAASSTSPAQQMACRRPALCILRWPGLTTGIFEWSQCFLSIIILVY